MKSTVEALEGNKVKVVVEVGEDEFEKDLDAAFKRLAKEVRLPGFRPGKAPRKVLEARIGQSYARDEAFREALPTYYSEAVKEHDVDVIAAPEIDITGGQEDGPVAFDAVVEIRPSITVEGYEGIEVELPTMTVSDEDIDASVDRMREGFSTLETVERPAIEDDTVVIDIETFHDGEPIDGLTTEDYAYKVGSNAVVPEIDEQLTDASAGDELEFSAAHPDEETDEPLEISIVVKEVQVSVLPEATDEWVAENSEFETLAELRADYEENLTAAKVREAQAARARGLSEALATLVVDDDVPAALVDMESDNQLRLFAMNLSAQGIDFSTWQQITGQSNEAIMEQMRENAEPAAKVDLALRAIAEAEDLAVTDDEIEAEFERIAGQVESTVDEVKENFADSGRTTELRSDLAKSKALDWVTERAKLVDEDGQPVSQDALELPAEDDSVDDSPEDSEAVDDETEVDNPPSTGEDAS